MFWHRAICNLRVIRHPRLLGVPFLPHPHIRSGSGGRALWQDSCVVVRACRRYEQIRESDIFRVQRSLNILMNASSGLRLTKRVYFFHAFGWVSCTKLSKVFLYNAVAQSYTSAPLLRPPSGLHTAASMCASKLFLLFFFICFAFFFFLPTRKFFSTSIFCYMFNVWSLWLLVYFAKMI